MYALMHLDDDLISYNICDGQCSPGFVPCTLYGRTAMPYMVIAAILSAAQVRWSEAKSR